MIDLAGVLAEEPIFTLESRPQVPLLARIREELEKAEDDNRVRAVVLRINSPGGTVTASDILYHEIMRFKERRKIPVVAPFSTWAPPAATTWRSPRTGSWPTRRR